MVRGSNTKRTSQMGWLMQLLSLSCEGMEERKTVSSFDTMGVSVFGVFEFTTIFGLFQNSKFPHMQKHTGRQVFGGSCEHFTDKIWFQPTKTSTENTTYIIQFFKSVITTNNTCITIWWSQGLFMGQLSSLGPSRPKTFQFWNFWL